ncbi:MAG: hypothetical protein SGARI_007303 [Bacillariaceae sp.]
MASLYHIVALVLCLATVTVHACSDFLVTPGASADGSAMIAYNADDVGLKGVLYHYPATSGNGLNETIPIYEWDTAK